MQTSKVMCNYSNVKNFDQLSVPPSVGSYTSYSDQICSNFPKVDSS